MTISRWNRNTYLLVLSLSIDGALRSSGESISENPSKLRTNGFDSNNRYVVGLLPLRRRKRAQERVLPASANASGGFRTTHAQSGSPVT